MLARASTLVSIGSKIGDNRSIPRVAMAFLVRHGRGRGAVWMNRYGDPLLRMALKIGEELQHRPGRSGEEPDFPVSQGLCEGLARTSHRLRREAP